MDIGTVVSWIQLGMWLLATVLFIGRLVRGEVKMSPRLKNIASSNLLIGVVILLGIVGSGASLYVNYTRNHFVDVSDIDPHKDLEFVERKTFINETIEVDGKYFQHCVFRNVHFVFHGRKTFGLEDNGFAETIAISTDDPKLSAFGELIAKFHTLDASTTQWRELDDKEHSFEVVKKFPPGITPL